MIRSAITVSIVPESKGGPFVFHGGLEAGIASAASTGFDGVEIFPSHADDIDGYLLRGWLEKYSVQLAAMGTGAGWLTRKLRLTDPDPLVRAAGRDFIGAIVDFAGGFGAPAIIGSMQGRHGDGVSREQALEWLRAELNQLGPRAHAHGVPLLYEPLNRYETNLFNTLSEAAAFLETLKTRNVKLLADLFHMNIEETDLAEAMKSSHGQTRRPQRLKHWRVSGSFFPANDRNSRKTASPPTSHAEAPTDPPRNQCDPRKGRSPLQDPHRGWKLPRIHQEGAECISGMPQPFAWGGLGNRSPSGNPVRRAGRPCQRDGNPIR